MALLIQAVILGILSGGVYALMASGMTLIFGVMRIINVAQGIFVILGAYLSYKLEQTLHLDLFVGLLLTMPAMFALGVVVQWAFIRRLKRDDRIMMSFLVTYAVALVIEGVLTFLFSTNYVQLYAWYVDATFGVVGFYFRYFDVFAFGLSVVLLAGLYLLVYRTRFGYSLRASMQDPTAAALIGIDVERVSAITLGLGTALAAAGGVGFGAGSLFNPASSYDLILRLVVIIVLGGLGSLQGALVASLLMLVVGSVTTVLWSDTWSRLVFFVLLTVLLVFRPQGLFGRLEARQQ
ncbi:MAG TPA: branched-chain amino acid ABC transporter permease [Ktedonobacteraceae bacterium]|nr:branched-chain amino acid ABC transporter permease [Ktedonobacteraceae bacterium]